MTTLTPYYSEILGGMTATNWQFNLNQLYKGGERVDPGPLLTPFSENKARCAVSAMSVDSAPQP